MIPKEENASDLSQFRTISLLSVEGKIFFSIVANRLTSYLLANSFIDTTVQKGDMPGDPGCVEHIGVVTQLVREARESKGDLVVLWLDLKNAYGSILHQLVELTLQKYQVPEKLLQLIKGYYSNFQLRFTTNDFVTEWHKLKVGIITGCTISVILFATAMNLLCKSAEAECRGPVTVSGIRQPPIRAFMDDLTVTTKAVTGARWLLTGLQDIISWARMEFKPTKSRSLVIKNGKVTNKYRFRVADMEIPSITEKPVKSLGKVFNSSLSDKDSIKQTTRQFSEWLSTIDKSSLPGKFKAWIYQHGLLPRILWPLLVYEFTMTTIEEYERKISGYIRRWLGLPRSLSNIALYGKSNRLQLLFSSITEEYKVSKVRQVLQYRDSKDEKVSGASINVRTGRKWDAQEAVNDA